MKRNQLLPIFNPNVFARDGLRQVKIVPQFFKDKRNRYLHLCETTIKTILDNIQKN